MNNQLGGADLHPKPMNNLREDTEHALRHLKVGTHPYLFNETVDNVEWLITRENKRFVVEQLKTFMAHIPTGSNVSDVLESIENLITELS